IDIIRGNVPRDTGLPRLRNTIRGVMFLTDIDLEVGNVLRRRDLINLARRDTFLLTRILCLLTGRIISQ
ncbi:MAG: hypothetical protein AB2693_27805, partial [Candidatus Thiodiazotropha sp.]